MEEVMIALRLSRFGFDAWGGGLTLPMVWVAGSSQPPHAIARDRDDRDRAAARNRSHHAVCRSSVVGIAKPARVISSFLVLLVGCLGCLLVYE